MSQGKSLAPGDAKPGDVVGWWHDTGAFGVSPCYATVISGTVMLTVRTEFGAIIRRRAVFFTRGIVTGSELDDFRSETANGIRKGHSCANGS